ncbi:MAG: DUF554 domain-containing protein [candidate division WOR-3 bacterium]|nr:DUF554 domain-containing protein [candidate division WOR-3 bacterium]
MTGTLINAGAVIAGSIIGLLLNRRLPEKITKAVFIPIGLFTIFLGVKMTLDTPNIMILVLSAVTGTIIGVVTKLDVAINQLGNALKSIIRSKNRHFTEGLVTAFLIFCMGSLTVLGAFEEGTGNFPNILLTKSIMDGFTSVILAASMGIGVMLSAIPLLIYQGLLTLFAGSLTGLITGDTVSQISGAGGLMLLGLGIEILEIKKLKIINMLPSLIIAGILAYFFAG